MILARNTFNVDEKIKGEFNKQHVKRMLEYVKEYKSKIILTIVLMLISTVASLYQPVLIMYVFDDYIPAKDVDGIVIMGILMLVLVFIGIICQGIKMRHMNTVGQGIIHKLRYDVFTKLQRLSFDYFDNRPHGKIMIRVVNYINALSDMFSNGIVNTITDLMVLFIIIIFMFTISVPLTLIALAGLPLLVISIGLLKNAQQNARRIYSNKSSNMNAYIHESLLGMKVTQSFAREEESLNIFKNLISDTKKSYYRAMLIQFLIWPIVDVISVLTVCGVYIAAVFWLAGTVHAVTIGTLVAFVAYIYRFWQPISNMSTFYNTVMTNMAYLERIFEVLDEKPLIEDSPDAYEMPRINGEIEFKNVTFEYDKGYPVIKNLSFKIRQGENIALVGHTGAGKTTVTGLVSRFYDVSDGVVLVDGIDIRDVTYRSLRKQMGVMMQDSFIFSGTVMSNIRYGNNSATNEEVIEAAKAVCADEFINQLPDGYNTEVNERGSTLSTGQRQLISFARALLADPKILILDEATSSIDTNTEIALQKGLQKLLQNRTSIVIAHRLSTIKNATRIFVIGDGGIKEEGTHEELLAKKGVYSNLYTAQFSFLNE